MHWGQQTAALRRQIAAERPLIHHITNWVVTNVTANATLALGASPVMAHAREEAAELARVARALILNIGTLTPETVEAMLSAGQAANAAGVPVVFDPVGVGATRLRAEAAQSILANVRVDIVRGNAAEIAFLAGESAKMQGVDSLAAPDDLASLASQAARQLNATVAITGARDHVSDGCRTLAVDNGHILLTRVTGTGCMATTAIAAFRAVTADSVVAAAAALAFYGLAAEQAATASHGPGTFGAALLDSIDNLTPAAIAAGVRITRL